MRRPTTSTWLRITLVAFASLAAAGCGGKSKEELSSENLTAIGNAVDEFRGVHGTWPKDMQELRESMGDDEDVLAVLKNPITGDDPGYEYVKLDEKDKWIIYQLRDGQRDMDLKITSSEPPDYPK